MHKRSVTARVVFALTQSAFAAETPQATLSVPAAFATEVTVKHYRKGQDLLHDPTFHLVTVAPLTKYHGWFGAQHVRQADIHGWTVYVFAHYSPKIAAACATAKNGCDADHSIEPEFFGLNERAYMFARFEHKHFGWGSAVSFLSQTVQDVALYVPHNGHLEYEVWGFTPDKKFTVVGKVSVSHPKLGGWAQRCESHLLWTL